MRGHGTQMQQHVRRCAAFVPALALRGSCRISGGDDMCACGFMWGLQGSSLGLAFELVSTGSEAKPQAAEVQSASTAVRLPRPLERGAASIVGAHRHAWDHAGTAVEGATAERAIALIGSEMVCVLSHLHARVFHRRSLLRLTSESRWVLRCLRFMVCKLSRMSFACLNPPRLLSRLLANVNVA